MMGAMELIGTARHTELLRPHNPSQYVNQPPSSSPKRTVYRAVKVIVGHLTRPTMSYLCIPNPDMIELAVLTISAATCIDKTETEF